MTTTRKLTALAALVADDLDTMAGLPADRITHLALTIDDRDQVIRMNIGAEFQHPTAELQASFTTTATWLRETLPAFAETAANIDVEDDDVYERYYPEQVSQVLAVKLLVDADVTVYWRTAELDGILGAPDIALMFTAAATLGLAWESFLEGDTAHLVNALDLASERVNRHGDRIPA